MRDFRYYLKTIIALILASLLLGLSVNCYIYANLGSDSITVFEEGLHNFLNISLGKASFIYSILFFVLALIFDRKYIGWTSIAYSLFGGLAIDIVNVFFVNLNEANIYTRLFLLIVAIISTSLSCSILIIYQSGMNSLDALATSLKDRFNIDYKITRTSLDIILMLCGYLMGGVIGIGTIVAVLSTGILIDFLTIKFKCLLNIFNFS